MRTPDRYVFVPLLGTEPVDDYTAVPHSKVWGRYGRLERGSDGIEVMAIDASNLDFGDVDGAQFAVGHELELFGAELHHMVDITDNDPTVPDVVYQMIAVRALNPVRED